MSTCQKANNGPLFIEGMRVDMVQIPGVIDTVEGWIQKKTFGSYIVVSNINDVVSSIKNARIKESVNKSTLSVPDGYSLVLLARMNGYSLKKRVYGPDLMLDFLTATENKGYSHFFYGSTPDTLQKLTVKLKRKFPDLNIAGFYSPPFRELSKKEDEEIVSIINQKSVDVIWIGLGCPKQQLWMYGHKDKLEVPAMIGVGAAFDFIAGTKKQAPKWMRESGFEWLFRLCAEPARLWKRYLLSTSIFLWLVCKELIVDSFSRNKSLIK